MINNISNKYTLGFGTKLMDANTLKFIPNQHIEKTMNERNITKKQVRDAVRTGDAYWNDKLKNYVIYSPKDPNRISAEDIVVIIDKTKKWIVTVMGVDPLRWFKDSKDLIHLSRKNNPTILKNVEPKN